jgi:hypothetical protein
MRTLAFLCAAFAAVTFCLPLSAQKARMNSSAAQAQLHINVIVVPTVAPPRHRERHDRGDDSVVYDLSSQDEQLSVMEEVRPMRVELQGKGLQHEQVRVTTVVMK